MSCQITQGGVTPIGSIVTAATALSQRSTVKLLELNENILTRLKGRNKTNSHLWLVINPLFAII